MSRYIDADKLMSEFHRYAWDTEDLHIDLIEDIVNDEPTADVRENVRGEWINHRNDNGHNIADCSVCGEAMQWFDDDIKPNFCPNCGADMRGGDAE